MFKATMPKMTVAKQKNGGKNIEPAEAYAPPHDMKGNAVDGTTAFKPYSRELSVKTAGVSDPIASGVSMGSARIKTDGIEMRGYGAATKGKISRGPMA